MNTTKIGDKFEAKVFNLIKREISQNNFFATSENCKIFTKKGYYSRDREKDIVFDISVEIFLPRQKTYSILVLIECKAYKHPIPVDDVEEFHSKIQQVSGANVKGIIAATNSFQEGTFNFSKSKGVGLLRFFDSSNFKWELTRSPSSLVSHSESNEACLGLINEEYVSRCFDCFCYSNGRYTNSIHGFLCNLLTHVSDEKFQEFFITGERLTPTNKSLVEFVDRNEIEVITKGILDKTGYTVGEVSLNKICDWQKEECGLKLTREIFETVNRTPAGVLGRISFTPLLITIFISEDHQEERERFTLAHELGHHFLNHSRYMGSEYVVEEDFGVDKPVDIGIKDIMRMEFQANYFASCLLLPKNQFILDFVEIAKTLELKNRGFGALYLDGQSGNRDNFNRATSILKRKYNVSRRAIKIRLEDLGILREEKMSRPNDVLNADWWNSNSSR